MQEHTNDAPLEEGSIDNAKLSISRHHTLHEWTLNHTPNNANPQPSISLHRDNTTTHVQLGTKQFLDNTPRSPITQFQEPHGDTLPSEPTVLTDCCTKWPAAATWTLSNLAQRTSNLSVSLDGGPSFARQSICRGKVSLLEYERYCNSESNNDAAPLYVFDPDVLTSMFEDGTPVQAEYSTPPCFQADIMHCLTGSRFRPLPPAWLLCGAVRSGTPIHDHPYTIAWNALLSGIKLWCCLPPDVDEELLLLNLDENGDIPDDEPFDLSAIEWFQKIDLDALPKEAKLIVQQPGEVVFLPKSWYHVVLNVETSVAISVSLTLRRDLIDLFPLLIAEDYDFALFWYNKLKEQVDGSHKDAGVSLEDICVLKKMLEEAENSETKNEQ